MSLPPLILAEVSKAKLVYCSDVNIRSSAQVITGAVTSPGHSVHSGSNSQELSEQPALGSKFKASESVQPAYSSPPQLPHSSANSSRVIV